MVICKAASINKNSALEIAKDLPEWFTKDALKNMKVDFEYNNLIVSKDKKQINGFLCYSTNSGKMVLIWMGVKRNLQRKGIGRSLLNWLENKANRLDLNSIEVETLPEEDDYAPYKQTREFYYKNGFKRIGYKKARIKGWDDQIVMEKKLK